jgi:hypothetical protein
VQPWETRPDQLTKEIDNKTRKTSWAEPITTDLQRYRVVPARVLKCPPVKAFITYSVAHAHQNFHGWPCSRASC